MSEIKNTIIKYEGTQIALFSDERNDYVNLTDLAKAWRGRKSILSWIRSSQTIEFLAAWERKYNVEYDGAQLSTVHKLIKDRNLSIKQWVELTKAKGIFTRSGEFAGTYAHKDIAIRFAGWLSPEFELYLIDEIKKLKELEAKINSYELLNEEQILALIRLKEVFKYVSHQTIIEDAHAVLFAAKSGAKNAFAEFHQWRNKILEIDPLTIDDRIKQYCVDNKIALTTRILKKPKREKILLLDSYEAVKHAVWDFLQIKGEVNALNLAKLVEKMIRIEKGEILRENETDLFHEKQDLGEFNDMPKLIDAMPGVKTARQLIAFREEMKKKQLPTNFNNQLKGLLNVPPEKKE